MSDSALHLLGLDPHIVTTLFGYSIGLQSAEPLECLTVQVGVEC